MASTAFDLLSGPLRECLWRMGWTHLRPIQSDAIHKILESTSDLIIAARTAAGKTEAAFLPILSRLVEQPSNSVGVVYISPLKALINDQFRRLEELCGYAEIPVHRRHGDVGLSAKKRLTKDPNGVLLITPESLESLFINQSSMIPRLFQDLKFVVIDELHAFVGQERGLHLRSLLSRLEQRIAHAYRLIALSATLGDWSHLYAQWMRPERSNEVAVLMDDGERKEIRLKIYGYTIGGKTEAELSDSDDAGHESVVDDMLNAFSGTTNLIFANRKNHVEWFADSLNQRCKRMGRPEEFLVHHGSLGKDVREDAERMMREATPRSTFCTSSLELGIDIGNVKTVGQIGSPWSVSSLVQRLGRSGRHEGEPSIMRMYIEEFAMETEASLLDRLHPELLQSIALTELMLEKWLEPPDLNVFDLSTLSQQILSVIAETGGMKAITVFERLVSRGAFKYVNQQIFTEVLRCLGSKDHIEQMPEGDLILGMEGERLVKRLDFYSAFASSKEYTVRCSGNTIGMLPAVDPPQPPENVLLAGRRWQVIEVDVQREEILVEPATGKKAPLFHGSGGEIHNRVRNTMRDIVLGNRPFGYLNACAQTWLIQARTSAEEAGLNQTPWHAIASNRCLLFTWSGTRTQRTLAILGRAAGLNCTEHDLAIEFLAPVDNIRSKLARVLNEQPTAEELLEFVVDKTRRKYDLFLNDELLNLSFFHDSLDLSEAKKVLQKALYL